MCGRDNRIIGFESHLEHRVASVLLGRPDVVELQDQPTPIEYRDPEGRWRKHTFDYLVKLSSGLAVAIAVKPLARTNETFLGTLQHVARHMPASFAEGIYPVDETAVSDADYSNSLLLREVMQDDQEDDYDFLDAIVSTINGDVRIGSLGRQLGRASSGFRPVVRLIAEGRLVPVDRSQLTPESWVRRARLLRRVG